MILSVSRRTDIPAFYSDWLLNRLKEGYVLVPNPRNPSRYSQVQLSPQTVDCIVFWTKNPREMILKLDTISAMGYDFYIQFTLTPYGREVEAFLPDKKELIETFQKLSAILGPKRVIWRYDPVILTDQMDVAYHLECFEKMAGLLQGCTERCVFSFLDFYARLGTTLRELGAFPIQEGDMFRIGEGFSQSAHKYRIQLSTCCESVDLSQFGITHASCIDGDLIEELTGCRLRKRKDTGQRPGCGCMESVDIGSYDSCAHGCRYCYGVFSQERARKNRENHDPKAPVLFGSLPENVIITQRPVKSLKDGQMDFFHLLS
ncbi:DUF1848 domain-containing protein [Lacrimispora sp.]|uniref:DUF1848 domain-containing protein n=1 Tax=Lacrimispora sp. TaxID=2719234 RepID=UPI0029E1EB20|nr:hypothetical protein [Lacrimispora sp.]